MSRNKKIDRKKGSEGIKKQTVGIYITDSLSDILRRGGDQHDRRQPLAIDSFLHKIELSSRREYKRNYQDFADKFGPLKKDDNFNPEKRRPGYSTKYIRNFTDGFTMDFFLKPVKPYMPTCYIEIHPGLAPDMAKYKRFLQEQLADNFPDLQVSNVEYTNDIYCVNNRAVEGLYTSIKRHIFVGYQNKVFDLKEPSTFGIGEKLEMNQVCHVGNGVKVYERGENRHKHGKGWPKESCDRVRLEYTVSRSELHAVGIDTIVDFLKDPKFLKLNKGKYRFVHFEKSKILPPIYSPYNSDPDNFDSVQSEQIYYRKLLKNIRQCTIDTPYFEELKSSLEECWKAFDKTWANR